jgi:hypothetical protein
MLSSGGELNHIKAFISNEGFIKASLVNLYQGVDFFGNVKDLSKGRIVLNVIGRGLPDDLSYSLITKTLQEVAPKYEVGFKEKGLEFFKSLEVIALLQN